MATITLLSSLSLTACSDVSSLPKNSQTTQQATPTPTASKVKVENPITNLNHLNSMLAEVPLTKNAQHTTYGITNNAKGQAIWVTSQHNDDGSYKNAGAGDLDGKNWSQGAYRLDDIATAAIVYINHWKLYGDTDSKNKAMSLLKTAAYMQNSAGAKAGYTVRWMQTDGSLNNENTSDDSKLLTSADINPSDSAVSDWFADYVWALGSGYSAFKDSDPDFAKFLSTRMQLSMKVMETALKKKSSKTQSASDVKPANNLLTDNVEVTSNITLGLSAYLSAEGSDSTAEKILNNLTEGIGAQASGDPSEWPFGAIMTSPKSTTYWSANNSAADAALTAAAPALKRSNVMTPALYDASLWTIFLMSNEGISSTLSPTISDANQTPVGIDLRLRSLITLGKQSESDGITGMAPMIAGWYFGANKGSKQMFDPNNGTFYNSLDADNNVDLNSSAESNIHGVLSMLALDENPSIKELAKSFTSQPNVQGVSIINADSENIAYKGKYEIISTPNWTGNSTIPNGRVVNLADKSSLSINIGNSDVPRKIFPIVQQNAKTSGSTEWFEAGNSSLGKVSNSLSGSKLPANYTGTVTPISVGDLTKTGDVTLSAKVSGNTKLIGILIQPQVTKISYGTDKKQRILYYNDNSEVMHYKVKLPDSKNWINKVYDSKGRYVSQEQLSSRGNPTVVIAPNGFSILEPVDDSNKQVGPGN
ncbi:MAG: hypothetical protein QM613_02825 [Micrococcaceae bacterium]